MSSNEHEMMVITTPDCDNAPKKRVLKEFMIACAEKDVDEISLFITEKIEWSIVNEAVIQGRENFIHSLESKNPSKVEQLEILNIITHGHTAAVNGTVSLEDGSVYSFCNVFRFVSAGKNVIKEITSYVLKNEENN